MASAVLTAALWRPEWLLDTCECCHKRPATHHSPKVDTYECDECWTSANPVPAVLQAARDRDTVFAWWKAGPLPIGRA